MSLLALSTPSVKVPDPTFTTPALPAGTSPGANTGFTFPNTPHGLVYAVVNMGSTAANYTVVGQNGNASVGPKALTVSVPNVIGPFDPALYSNSSGLVQINLSSVTGITGVAAVIMPAGTPITTFDELHNPFEATDGATDS
jgi:hypothetical protein